MRAWLSIAIAALLASSTFSSLGCTVSSSDDAGSGAGSSDTTDGVELVGLDGRGNEVPVTTAADAQRHAPTVVGMGGASEPKTGAAADGVSESSDPWLSVLGPVPDPWREDYTAQCTESHGSGKNTRP